MDFGSELSFGGRSVEGFGLGTFLRQPSVEDLRNLINAKDYELNQIYKHYMAFWQMWETVDLPAKLDWANDWNALLARYKKAKETAQWAFDKAAGQPWPDSVILAPDEWNTVLRALRKNWDGKTGGTLEKGDEADLEFRLSAASHKSSDFSHEPQPTGDVDLEIFKAADKATKGIETVAGKIANYVPIGLAIGAGILVLVAGAYVIALLPKSRS